MLRSAGFIEIEIDLKDTSRDVIKEWLPGSGAEDFVCSANITAYKPGGDPDRRMKLRQQRQTAEMAAAAAAAAAEAEAPSCRRNAKGKEC